MSTKNNNLRVRWTVKGVAYCEVFTSKRGLIECVKATFEEAGLSTAQDAVKALKTIHAKAKAMGHVWQDQTAKKATKRASRASGRRYEHHARNELMKNLEKSSGAPRGGEAIEITLAKDLKEETRKAAKARRMARKVKPYVEAALTAKFKADAQDSEQIAVLKEVTKTSHVEIKTLCIEAEAVIAAEEAETRRKAELEAATEKAAAKAALESAKIVEEARERNHQIKEAEFDTIFEALTKSSEVRA